MDAWIPYHEDYTSYSLWLALLEEELVGYFLCVFVVVREGIIDATVHLSFFDHLMLVYYTHQPRCFVDVNVALFLKFLVAVSLQDLKNTDEEGLFIEFKASLAQIADDFVGWFKVV